MSTGIISEAIRVKFPLHAFVWENDYRTLEKQLPQSDIEAVDPRGRTALHLAVSLGHVESARVLLRHGAEVTKENSKNWTVLQEAVSTGDPEMVQSVLQRRDYFKASAVLGGVPELLSKIRESPDFYVEMKWEFTSWIPLVSRLCPSDVCRIWKSGCSLRVDTTLLGFENTSWVRGSRSYIFRSDDACTEMMDVNHDERVVEIQRFNILSEMKEVTLEAMEPAEQQVTERLTTPIVNTYLDTKHIAFERNKSGMWGWRTDRTEVVNGFEAKVFGVNNANVVIRTRTEHLTDTEKARIKHENKALETLLGTEVQHDVPASPQGALTAQCATATNPSAITPEEYFDPEFDLKKRDIGRPIELNTRIQKFKGTLWMSEDHPLSLVEQVTPIIDLMARTSPHFARLRDFVALKFPPGFPVKIEIPLFHVLNARITFGNVNECRTEKHACARAATSTTPMPAEGGTREAAAAPPPPPFQVCPSVFVAPVHYRHQEEESPSTYSNCDDEHLLQYAIQQSLLDSCSNKAPGQDVAWYDAKGDFGDAALGGQSNRSLVGGASSLVSSVSATASKDPDVQRALELSARAQEEEEKRRKQEEEELERILQLSLTEK